MASAHVALFVDTFTNWFEPENASAALRVLEAAGCRVHIVRPKDPGKPLCCGRTFLTAGLIDEARSEARRLIDALTPLISRGVPVVGLEPSCLLGLRDEYLALFPRAQVQPLADQAFLLEEWLCRSGLLSKVKLEPLAGGTALVHGHCHQKALGVMPTVEQVMRSIPGLSVETIQSSCCGMAGSFGYEAEHYAVSLKMAEASLLPAVRAAPEDAVIVADGVSCRHQIHDGTGREAVHVARLLERCLA